MRWTVQFLDEEVKAALEAFPPDIQASFQRVVELIQLSGLERVREPYVKRLEGPVWEMAKAESPARPTSRRKEVV